MKFVLEVDMTGDALADDAVGELGRILRYWAGNLRHYALAPGDEETIHDSAYGEVGRWHVTSATG
ncbi:hypothetical protein GCM10020221_25190 [Streptomyces thioluteus]|uniref:Uncharacterized protein n=1 Tax=Streptomyces thioluteus TaxID=66431 RepID=A0ABP6JE89_STRTU